ncbi:hypothetical protein [Polaribacter cellanae]|uniref:SEC-C domain-containing protein n=1 Tax=Polaribacter cellanae TaxID=2818493 RepID=A0A975CS23_9FLAO|nr:hypothetical protein [Polaribacter cellanae]QTE24232.1 hypothetical protein J3359_08215 [Polaribacter cellanae]
MAKNALKKDVDGFLNKYFSFEKVESPKTGYLALEGKISVLDRNDKLWGQFEILILVNEKNYPYTIPIVIEKTEIIERDWDFHISKEGECCLNIPHKLLKLKKRGIVFEDFYREVIYPFFANYHYKVANDKYANGEYEHHFKGIAQFYREEYGLKDYEDIIALLEITISGIKHQPNKQCPLCGGPKYKKCCRKKVYSLRAYGLYRLERDLALFRENSLKTESISV